nr:ATP-dependent RecD-like DNA helicase [Synechococcus sp. PCC 6312]
MASPTVEEIQGTVERVTFHSPDSGYTIARLDVKGYQELVTIIGSFPQLQAGTTIRLWGQWREYPKYGSQLQVQRYEELKPATLNGIEKYLGSGLIKGVGQKTARKIVNHFGLETLEIIESQVDRLIEVPGLGERRVKQIQGAWNDQRTIRDVMVFLQGHGVSPTHAVKIFKQYGEQSVTVVTDNPYRLATDIYGIGFVTADAIARKIGITPNSEYRYQAGIRHVLDTAGEDGHCFLPLSQLVSTVIERLTLDDHVPKADQVEFLLNEMVRGKQIMRAEVNGEGVYYAPPFYRAEMGLAKAIQALTASSVSVDMERVDNWLRRYSERVGLPLAPKQLEAVRQAVSQRLLILTGGPGTGKTFTTRTIATLWRAMGKKVLLASPTGRAAQRLSEVTGQEAITLHRLLEFSPKSMQFQRNEDNPLEADAVIVDEVSMLDLFLAYSLMRAIPLTVQVLLVGDADQLPSVGAGAVLRDLINSQAVPVVRLTEVFRQAQTSAIVTEAHRINQGQYPKLEPMSDTPESDCLWHGAEEAEQGVIAITSIVSEFIPTLGFDPRRDVQVLCPMTRSVVGTRNLNAVLQSVLNPSDLTKPALQRGGQILRVGDRVLQRVNDYDRDVFNGDLGWIEAIDPEEQETTVCFGNRSVTYDWADLDEITLAWPCTIHKSQGSEFPVVILPMYMQHYLMLSRNLLYTGLTRARKLAILVGPKKAIGLAVRETKDKLRFTRLKELLITP